jgi:hypothetical protein
MKKLIVIFLVFPVILEAQNVTNVRSQKNGNKIDVNYRLDGLSSNQTVKVNLYYSVNNSDYSGPLQEVSGDIGNHISGNGNKKITWDVLSEIGSLKGDTKFKVEIIPNQNFRKPKASTKDLKGVVESCHIDGKTLTVDFVLESNINKTWTFFANSTVVFDENGQKYYAETFKWGNNSDVDRRIELMKDVPFKIRYIFTNVAPSIKKLNGATLTDKWDKFSLRFRNIPVIKSE